MATLSDQPLPLQDWCVLSLRPRNQHGPLRAACLRRGARVLAISPLAIRALEGSPTRQVLATALAADLVLFTSPNAARAAAALTSLHARRGQHWLAVGEGTRRALQRVGIAAIAPTRMDSEGLLALPVLQTVQHQRIGLITAPGGRGKLVPALQARGAQVIRADVYARQVVALAPARLQALQTRLHDPARILLALSSGEALQALLAQLPDALQSKLHRVAVVAASQRLAELAQTTGFRRITVAHSARPAALLQAAERAFV